MRVCDNGTFRDATIAEMDAAAKAQAEEEAAELNREPTPEERLDALETTTDDMILLMAELIGGE